MIADGLSRIAMSSGLAAALSRATDYARANAHVEVGLEHILLALCDDPDAVLVLASSNVNVSELIAEVSGLMSQLPTRMHGGSGELAVASELRRILEAAAAAARGGRRREINGAIVLAAIVGDGKSAAANVLSRHGMTFEGAIRALQSNKPPEGPARPKPAPNAEGFLAGARERVQSRSIPSHRDLYPEPEPEPEPEDEPAPPPPVAHEPDLPPEHEPTPADRPPLPGAPFEPHPLPGPPGTMPEFRGPPEPPPPPPFETPSLEEPAAESADLESFESASAGYEPELPPAAAESVFEDAHELSVPPGPHLPPPMPASAPFPPPIPPPGGHAPASHDGWAPPPMPGPRLGGPPPPPPPGRAAPPPMPPLPSAAPARAAPPPLTPWPESDGRPAGVGSGARSPPEPAGPAPKSFAQRAGARPAAAPRTEIGQLVENIPRAMRVAVTSMIEVRVARAHVQALAEGLQGGGAAYHHEVTVTKAMSVRLRAPDGGFFIETASPETQWIEKSMLVSGEDFAAWRWHVTPREAGKRRLQLIISARTVSGDGLAAETALPDQVITVRVRTNYGKLFKRWVGWGIAAIVGGLLAKFGEGAFALLGKLTSG